MSIIDHKYSNASYYELARGNLSSPPKYIVIHYSAGGSLEGALSTLKRKGFSYHILVDLNGSATQCVPFDKRSHHSGVSNWKGSKSLNRFSIGICAINFGYLDAHSDGLFFNTNTHHDPITPKFTRDQVVVSEHKFGSKSYGWQKYSPQQLATIRDICTDLVAEYPSIIDIIGHDDVAIKRKSDPGPAFEYEGFYDLFPNRLSDVGPRYRVNTPNDTLNIRRGPSKQYKIIGDLEHGQELSLLSIAYKYVNSKPELTPWYSISINNTLKHVGFVHKNFLLEI